VFKSPFFFGKEKGPRVQKENEALRGLKAAEAEQITLAGFYILPLNKREARQILVDLAIQPNGDPFG